MKIRDEDRPVLLAMARVGMEVTLKEMAEETGYTPQRLASVAKRYDGQWLGRLRVTYLAPMTGSMRREAPGIKNPRTGICERVPAVICVDIKSKKRS